MMREEQKPEGGTQDDRQFQGRTILTKYEITPDTYQRQFRYLKIESGGTPQELYVRLKDLFSKWVKPEKSTLKEITETIILEQFLRMVHPELEAIIL
ncbi:Zinc finger protein 202 [Dissostichus eleginoides]|uniref:Zinc finger protein 202 n=1 Tax=Dissostichus eleginoides TaxID=100907 RepID=A0AAD9BV35_DISEL|nr:Zinc finger protein 202 [Dissostichus eleginoides]